MNSNKSEKGNFLVENIDLESNNLENIPSNANDFTQARDFNDIFDPEKYGQTQRQLNSRHISLLIIGQSIGTGLFIGVSSPLATSGSLSLFLGFVIYAFGVIYPLMQCVAEMCTWLPIKGSFFHFAARFLDPALGFSVCLIYIYTAMMFTCVEVVAFGSVIGFWSDLNPGVWIAIGLVTILFFNVFGVKWYGEIEFYSSILKVILIVGLMLFSLISMCGGNPHHNAYGFQHWKEGGLVKPYLVEGNTGKFLGFWNVMIYAAFSCGGPDLLALVSGETRNPRKVIAMAGRRSYIRLYLFYLGGIFFLNTICSSINPTLLTAREAGKLGAAASPWVIGVRDVGVHGLDALVNVVVMTSAWSCGNGFIYSATRGLYSAALAGYVPRIFAKCLSNGAPIYSVVLSISIGGLAFLSVSNSTLQVFNWFVNLATTGMLCTYFVMFLTYFKYVAAFKAQGFTESDSYYKAPFNMNPYVSYFGCGMTFVILLFNGFWIFFPGQFSIANLFTCYFAPVLFILLTLFWKMLKKTKYRSHLEADIITGKDVIDREEVIDKEEELRLEDENYNGVYNVWYKICDVLFS